MVYANVVLGGGARGVRARARPRAGASGLIVPDLPHDEAGELRAGLRRGAASRWCRSWRPPPPPSGSRAIGADARGFVYTVSLTGTTGERAELPPRARRHGGRVRGAPRAARGGGLRDLHGRSTRGAVAELADGVIVGSRVVRAAAEGGADAVGELVAELRRGLL